MSDSPPPDGKSAPWRRLARECAGACGDLGTFIPHAVGAMTVAGLAPAGVLFGFGLSLVAAGLFYGLPMAVQPMKAISAVLLSGQLTPEATAAAGLIIGALLLVLGSTGLIGRVARLIPQSVTAGLQLGLGITMGWLGLGMIAEAAWIGLPALALLFGLPRRWPEAPVAPLVLLAALGAGLASGLTALPEVQGFSLHLPALVLPESWEAVWQAVEQAVLPQMPLTLTNAVIVTAALCRDLYPDRAARATARNLALTSGVANLLLAPLGAMPMCHGAGGVAAQHRFGARTGLAPVLLGTALLILALGFAGSAAALFAAIPPSAVGALLLVAGSDLALSRRLFDARPNCWPAIGVAAAATAFLNPALGLAAGWAVEILRGAMGKPRRRTA
ncbi:putative sulfate/molybdate transporter [Roseomonas sp. E05]|uniref:putative sulfate/molybdate transporter n=1 Tax=Roseomonas sp. E05 TaxID=3046310 RepID=UPI0024B89282|nr:putative sulfate/molybdate transporter [Roseomonas sp. E05]MDJ0388948.1 putative sulfate/molybdate transporter [Roseomonas sp. E05]